MVTGVLAGDVPQVFVHVAVYVPAPTLIVVPVAELLHVTVPIQFDAVKVASSLPHTNVLFAVMLGANGG